MRIEIRNAGDKPIRTFHADYFDGDFILGQVTDQVASLAFEGYGIAVVNRGPVPREFDFSRQPLFDILDPNAPRLRPAVISVSAQELADLLIKGTKPQFFWGDGLKGSV